MIDFQPFSLEKKDLYNEILMHAGERGCEYSFTNQFLWGRQQGALLHGHLTFFSQFNRRSVYLYPVGTGDKTPVIQAIMEDARQRGIPCRFTGLTQDDCAELERLFPGRFRYHFDRNSFDYVYSVNDLAQLAGRKFQRKRNHLNRFLDAHPSHTLEPISDENVHQAALLVEQWYETRQLEDPTADFLMEKAALRKALKHRKALGMEGLLLKDGDTVLAMTMGSPLSETTFDIHFEKALDRVDGAYAAINRGFARYLQEKYPKLLWLNREDDLGLEGLRKAKLSYCPDHMIEKNWACLLEDGYEY